MANKGWKDEEMLSKALEILDVDPKMKDAELRYPFLTPYQVAIEFKKLYPAEFLELGYKVGGLDIKEHKSLAQQFSRMLTSYSKKEDVVEKQCLHRCHLPIIIFSDDENEIEPCKNQDIYLTMFRLKK